ncbi:MAG TPA: VCBS repeat-containing protein [Candidatus Udaeobacter sp.]|jgi:hypothetical protein|nr:VCBS repeat-containing protein [Candidatus Udaeobacter sp.]
MNKHFFSSFSFGFLIICFVSIGSVVASTEARYRTAPVPFINQPLVPDAIAPGSGDFTLTINGTGFLQRSVVKWNGQKRATHFISDHKLTAIIRASDIATANTASITVATCAPGGGTSNVVYFPVTNATTSVSFTESLFPTGIESYAVVSGDFNEDGKVDLVMGDQDSHDKVSVLLGNGDGTFQPYVTYLAADGPFAVATGDFNEDGHLDLAIRCTDVVSILLGKGDGTFAPAANFGRIPRFAVYLKTADLNGDGHMDLVVANGSDSSRSVSVFLGNGDGTLQFPTYSSGPYNAVDVAVGDYDGDGNLDLAVLGTWLAILHGRGDGSFDDISDYTLRGGGDQLITADFNGDFNLDLAIPDANGAVHVLLGNGDGTFQASTDYATDLSPYLLAVGDLNGDGYLDLVTNSSNSAVSTLLGNGDGTFQPYQSQEILSGSGSIAIADFNRDGRLDIATPRGGGTCSILLQNSTGDFSSRR